MDTETLPNTVFDKPCRQGHLEPQRGCRACHDRTSDLRKAEKWEQQHGTHRIASDRRGTRRCLTCHQHNRYDEDNVRAVVERLLPDHDLTRAERIEAARRLDAQGMRADRTAALLGCSERTVFRYLKARRDAPEPRRAPTDTKEAS